MKVESIPLCWPAVAYLLNWNEGEGQAKVKIGAKHRTCYMISTLLSLVF